jgi:hypothetical protein
VPALLAGKSAFRLEKEGIGCSIFRAALQPACQNDLALPRCRSYKWPPTSLPRPGFRTPVAHFSLPEALMTKKTLLAMALISVWAPAFADVVRHEIVPSGNLAGVVRVSDVRIDDNEVRGVIQNLTADELRDVQLLVRDTFLWTNERHPGTDDPSRAQALLVPGPIPPHGSVAFTAPRSPLMERRDGSFESSVEVTAVTRQPLRPEQPAQRVVPYGATAEEP